MSTEPMVTIPYSEYERLKQRPFFEVDRENKLFRRFIVFFALNQYDRPSFDSFCGMNGCSISVHANAKTMQYDPDDVTISFNDKVTK